MNRIHHRYATGGEIVSQGRNRVWPLIAWASPLLPAFAYYRGYRDAFLQPYGAAMIFGVFGICYFLNALILSTRIRYFDRMYGHDRVMRFHARMATVAFLLIVIHRQLKIMDGKLVPTGQIIVGTIALIIFAVIITVTFLFMVKNNIHRLKVIRRFRSWVTSRAPTDYSKLKILHNLLPLAAMAAVVHVILAGRMAFMGAYALSAAILYIRFKFIRPLLLRRQVYTVTEIRNPGGNVTEVRLTGKKISFTAGQYAYWRLKSRAVGNEEHPFTISSAPGEEEIGFSAKALGDYTASLSRLRLGDEAIIDGPYGKFVLPPDDSISVLLIAGGIGITPFRSMIRNMADHHSIRHTTLVWGVRNRDDLVYDGEFLQLAKRLPFFRYKPVIEKQDEVTSEGTLADFESGRVTKGLIRGLCPDLSESNTIVYICGPDSMREAIVRILKSIGVTGRHIRFEKFSLG